MTARESGRFLLLPAVLECIPSMLREAHLIQKAYLEYKLIVEHWPEVSMRMCAAQRDLAHSHIPCHLIRDPLRAHSDLSVRRPHGLIGPKQMHGAGSASSMKVSADMQSFISAVVGIEAKVAGLEEGRGKGFPTLEFSAAFRLTSRS